MLQYVVAIAVELALADAGDAPQFVEVVGRGLRDGPQRGVVEDDVRGDVLLARRGGAPLAQGVEAQLRVGRQVDEGGGSTAAIGITSRGNHTLPISSREATVESDANCIACEKYSHIAMPVSAKTGYGTPAPLGTFA